MSSWDDLQKLDSTIKPEDDAETRAWLNELGSEEEWSKKMRAANPDIDAAQERIDNLTKENHEKQINEN